MNTAPDKTCADTLLEVRQLSASFRTRSGVVEAVRGVDFTLHKGEILGIVGESGCGKSVTVGSILGLNGKKRHETVTGEVLFHGQNLLQKSERQMQKIRGSRISMIFQDPMTSLNPVVRVGTQVGEPERIHTRKSGAQIAQDTIRMMEGVGIPSPELRVAEYPHEFSGGMRQRSIIAMSLMCSPEIIVADEPTTALDVTIQAQIIDLLRRLRDETGVAIILISHDMGVVAELCDTVAVMYAGEIVEKAGVEELFARPAHPYTRGLLGCISVLGQKKRLTPIPGQPPKLIDPPRGCRFAERCPLCSEECGRRPELRPIMPGHMAACWKEAADKA